MIFSKVFNGTLYGVLNLNKCKDYKVPPSVKKIEPGAFKGAVSLETIILPEGLEEIGESAFEGCSALKKIVFPSSLKTVGNFAFKECISLEEIGFCGELPFFDGKCFQDCRKLSSIWVGSRKGKIVFLPRGSMFWFCWNGISYDNVSLYKGVLSLNPTLLPEPDPTVPTLYVAIATDEDGNEFSWSALDDGDAIEGAVAQARHESYRQHYGDLRLDTQVCPKDISMIFGFCQPSVIKTCNTLGYDINCVVTIRELLDILAAAAPGAFRRAVYVLQHQDDIDTAKYPENHMTLFEAVADRPTYTEKLTWRGE